MFAFLFLGRHRYPIIRSDYTSELEVHIGNLVYSWKSESVLALDSSLNFQSRSVVCQKLITNMRDLREAAAKSQEKDPLKFTLRMNSGLLIHL